VRFIQYLQEEYITIANKQYKDWFPIYKNPSQKELREIDQTYGIRFIVDIKKQDLYCFPGGALHALAYDALNFKRVTADRFWQGVGEYKKGKLKALMVTADDLEHYSWLKTYMVPGI